MKQTLTFDFWTSMRECCGSQVGSFATITLDEADASKFLNLFAADDELFGDEVEAALGADLWSLLRKAMDEQILRRMHIDALNDFESEFEDAYEDQYASSPCYTPWEELSRADKLDFVAANSDPDFHPDWDIAAIARPEVL